jgi:cyanophycinase-like exopeptidase
LCQKDRKIIEIGGIILPVCGFPFLCSTLLAKHSDLASKLQGFCSVLNCHGTVLMGISIDEETDIVKRDLVVYSHLAWLKNRVLFSF